VTETLALATAGQLRRAGFIVEPKGTDDSATAGFDVLVSAGAGEEAAQVEHATAIERGDAFPKGKP
jgi:hypothetical protein